MESLIRTLNLCDGDVSEGNMPSDVVLECIGEDRVQVEEGASLEARALPSSSCAHQHIREENEKTISLLSTPFLFQNKEESK